MRNAGQMVRVGMVWLAGLGWAGGQVIARVERPNGLRGLEVTAHGRVLVANAAVGLGGKEYRSQWPGVSFEAAFEGQEVYFGVGASHEILHVTVDGAAAGEVRDPAAGVYRVSGLGKGRHVVRVSVATESQVGVNTFEGFGFVAGQALPKPVGRVRQMEFIGDSHSVGYGDASGKRVCTEDEIWATTDDTRAFGALTAVHFGADYEVNAISGRGVVRNYDGFRADTLPEAYPYALFGSKVPVAAAGWDPQVIVVALGTNDFSTALHAGEVWKTRDELHATYEREYGRFLAGLRVAHPKAFVIVWATDKADGEIEREARKVVDGRAAAGDGRVVFLAMDGLQFGGCNSHPDLGDERVISGKLVGVVEGRVGVWDGR